MTGTPFQTVRAMDGQMQTRMGRPSLNRLLVVLVWWSFAVICRSSEPDHANQLVGVTADQRESKPSPDSRVGTQPPPSEKNSSQVPVAGFVEPGATIASYELSGMAMGMGWKVHVWCRDDVVLDRLALKQQLQAELERLESIFSLYQSQSEISRWNHHRATDWQVVSPDFARLVQEALRQARQSEGAFDPTIAGVMEARKFRSIWPTSSSKNPQPRRQNPEVIPTIDWEAVEVTTEPPQVRKNHPEIQLDLNALVEGLALEKMRGCCQRAGVLACLVSLGGEYLIDCERLFSQTWNQAGVKIFVESPADATKSLAVVRSIKGCVSTSGTYRQTWPDVESRDQVSHLIAPQTGQPLKAAASLVSVYHENPILADGWATSLMVAGRDKGLRLANQYQLAALFYSAEEDEPLIISEAGKGIFVPLETALVPTNPFKAQPAKGVRTSEENSSPVVSGWSWGWKMVLCIAGMTALIRFARFAAGRVDG